MSSYFDTVARKFQQASTQEDKRQILLTVQQRVGEYLTWIETNCLKAEQHKVAPLREAYTAMVHRPLREGLEYRLIEDLHDLGHDIGRARIQIRRRGSANDNPYAVSGSTIP